MVVIRDRTVMLEVYKRESRLARGMATTTTTTATTTTSEYMRLVDGKAISSGAASSSPAVAAVAVAAPRWVHIVESIHSDVAVVKQLLDQLKVVYHERLGITFNDALEKLCDAKIQNLTGDIVQILKRSEQNVKRIAIIDNPRDVVLGVEEALVRANAMRSVGAELMAISKQFRQLRDHYVQRAKDIDNLMHVHEPPSAPSLLPLTPSSPSGHQSAMMTDTLESQAFREREQSIIELASQVNELSGLFKELNVLVLDQGTTLDRIDYNIERALNDVTIGTNTVTKMGRDNKVSAACKCVLFLIGLVVFLATWLAITFSARH